MEKFSGNGKIFLHGHGQVIEINLGEGENIEAEAGHVLAFSLVFIPVKCVHWLKNG